MITVNFVNVGGHEPDRKWTATMPAWNERVLLHAFAKENQLKSGYLFVVHTSDYEGCVFNGPNLVGTFICADETDQLAVQE